MTDAAASSSHVGPVAWPDGVQPPREATIPALVDSLAESAGNRAAVAFDGRELTYAALSRRSMQAAGALISLGVQRGSVVGLLAPNSDEWLVVLLGAIRLGAQVHAFNTWVRPAELDYLLSASRAEVLVSAASFASNDLVASLLTIFPDAPQQDPRRWEIDSHPHLRSVVVLGPAPAGSGMIDGRALVESAAAFTHDHSTGEDDSVVVYTSGSTSEPKAVPLVQRDMIVNGFAIGERMHLSQFDRVWIASPLFWSFGVANATMATFTHGACLVVEERFDAQKSVETMRRERCTAAYLLPVMAEGLFRNGADRIVALDQLRTGVTIGRLDEVERIAIGLGIGSICNVYGSTETYGNCCVTDAEDPLEDRTATQGLPLPGVEIRVVAPGTEKTAPRGTPGDLQVRGRIMPGYLPSPTGSVITSPITPDGWFDTGDTAIIRDDGRMVFVVRHSETIKTSGINVSPAEIETTLLTHRAVVAAAVVPAPHSLKGEVPVAFVVASEPVDERALVEHCLVSLSSYKIPARVVVVPELPLTATGKLARKSLVKNAGEIVEASSAS